MAARVTLIGSKWGLHRLLAAVLGVASSDTLASLGLVEGKGFLGRDGWHPRLRKGWLGEAAWGSALILIPGHICFVPTEEPLSPISSYRGR